MAISVRQLSEKCLRPRGPFSIVRNILGYSGPGVPQVTSLTKELIRFRDQEHVTLHIKIVSTATWAFTSGVSIDEMIFSMRLVYGNANIALLVKSTENLVLPDSEIDVGKCTSSGSDEANALYDNNRNFVGPFEIVVYFVRSVLKNGTKASNGCAPYSRDKSGALVASIGSRWTLGHEVGHVIGLCHVEGVDCPADKDPPETHKCMLTNLMTCCGTGSIPAGTTPTFDDFQKEVIKLSPLSLKCAA